MRCDLSLSLYDQLIYIVSLTSSKMQHAGPADAHSTSTVQMRYCMKWIENFRNISFAWIISALAVPQGASREKMKRNGSRDTEVWHWLLTVSSGRYTAYSCGFGTLSQGTHTQTLSLPVRQNQHRKLCGILNWISGTIYTLLCYSCLFILQGLWNVFATSEPVVLGYEIYLNNLTANHLRVPNQVLENTLCSSMSLQKTNHASWFQSLSPLWANIH